MLVRAVAVSRKRGFSKTALHARPAAEGIAYVHVVELGDPKPSRDVARARNYDEFRTVYSQYLKIGEARAVLKVLKQTIEQETVCLLCYERDPATCHRRMIADRLKGRGLDVFDLFVNGQDQMSATLKRSRVVVFVRRCRTQVW